MKINDNNQIISLSSRLMQDTKNQIMQDSNVSWQYSKTRINDSLQCKLYYLKELKSSNSFFLSVGFLVLSLASMLMSLHWLSVMEEKYNYILNKIETIGKINQNAHS